MLAKLFMYIKGYLIISVRGKFPERFLNLCALFGIHIISAKVSKEEVIIKTSIKAFRKMLIPAHRSSCHIHIVKKVGLPFKIKRYSKRKALILGAVIFTLALFIINSFIVEIRIDGNETVTDEEIKILLEYCGLKKGMIKYKLDENKFSERALAAEPRLSWIWPKVKGQVLYIEVREKKLIDKPLDLKKPCDVIAKRSGIIKSITIKRGNEAVSVGQSVIKGQTLINSKTGELSPVHADGKVIASRWIEKSKLVTSNKITKEETGNVKKYYSLLLGNFGMKFRFTKKEPYPHYHKEKVQKEYILFGFRVKIEKEEYKELLIKEDPISIDTAIDEAVIELRKEAETELDGETIENEILTIKSKDENKAEISVIYEFTGDIAIKKYIETTILKEE